ncbi:hypothetical protein [Abyssalbus ytuae]|uniref:Uncharacterized protein n=1 Tax=Abyssalbus ytuae TaxID=2926907 RepID=A0A9E7CTZ8_9FLAO|nr:hypothetical protein [Abyssalbus ytuae]UOB17232.1 hypothetical protein MQE35_16035 [Abyssalbus ytuae]
MNRKIDFEFGTLEIFNDYAIGEINEGIDFKCEQNEKIISVCKKYFKDRPFGYISNRTTSFSIDPSIYNQLRNNLKNLVAIAVIAKNPAQILSTNVEQIFFGKSLQHFSTMNDGVIWLKDKLDKVYNTSESKRIRTSY